MAQPLSAVALAALLRVSTTKAGFVCPDAESLVSRIAAVNTVFRQQTGLDRDLFQPDLSALPDVFSACSNERSLLNKMSSLRRLLRIDRHAAKAILGESAKNLDDALLAELLLKRGGRTYDAGMFVAFEGLAAAAELNSATEICGSLSTVGLHRSEEPLQSLWTSVLKSMVRFLDQYKSALEA